MFLTIGLIRVTEEMWNDEGGCAPYLIMSLFVAVVFFLAYAASPLAFAILLVAYLIPDGVWLARRFRVEARVAAYDRRQEERERRTKALAERAATRDAAAEARAEADRQSHAQRAADKERARQRWAEIKASRRRGPG